MYDSRLSSKKGITPIIATVLLLGITVAIGLTVYTQAQGLIEGTGSTDQITKVRETQISLSPVFGDGGEMSLQVNNKGERAINVSKYTIYYGPPNFKPVSYSTINSSAVDSEWSVGDGNNCFTTSMKNDNTDMSNSLLEPEERASCSTGVKFPDALEAVDIRVEADGFDYSTTYDCEVESSSARTC